MRSKLIILDIETYLYKAVTACEVLTQDKKDRFIYRTEFDLRKGMEFIDETIKRLKETLNAQYVELVVGDVNNFRKELYPKYKSHRASKPPIYPILFNLIKEKYGVNSLPNLEADDACRIMYEDSNWQSDKDKIIVSVDKDFYSVPCTFYRDLPSNEEGLVFTSKKDAERNLMKQVIMGDKTDGYEGVKGFGEAKTTKYLDKKPTWDNVRQLFIDNGMGVKDYLMNLNCARIVGIDKYNFDTGVVSLEQGGI